MKKKFLKTILLVIATFSFINESTAYNGPFPPFTNEEIKEQANSLLKLNLYNRAENYYKELEKRGDKINSTWGLALVDIEKQEDEEALKKINSLLSSDKLQLDKLNNLKAQLLIKQADRYINEKNIVKAQYYLNQYMIMPNESKGFSNLHERALAISNKLHNKQEITKINVGVILPLSGKLASLGKEIQNAMILTMYNEGFSNISLFFEDNKSTQDGSLIAATKVINKRPNIIVGPILRDNVLAANTIVENTNIPIFSLSNDISIAGQNIFMNNVNLNQESFEVARFALDSKRLNLACLAPNNKYGKIQNDSFLNKVSALGGSIDRFSEFASDKIDITPALRNLLNLDKIEEARNRELKLLKKEFDRLGNAMSDEKINRMKKLEENELDYDVEFSGIFIPASPQQLTIIAPQLAFYDIDFSNNVQFLGNSSWDDKRILRNKGEHLHFSRFLSLKSNKFKEFEKLYEEKYKKSPTLISGFASDILHIASDLSPKINFYRQIYRPQGFTVLTGNVKFARGNIPQRVYGINRISRRKITAVENVKSQRPAIIPEDLSIEKSSVFNGWFGFN